MALLCAGVLGPDYECVCFLNHATSTQKMSGKRRHKGQTYKFSEEMLNIINSEHKNQSQTAVPKMSLDKTVVYQIINKPVCSLFSTSDAGLAVKLLRKDLKH